MLSRIPPRSLKVTFTGSLHDSICHCCQCHCKPFLLRSCGLDSNSLRCYEAKIEESERLAAAGSQTQRIVRVDGRLAVVAQWQNTGGSSQRCPGFDSWLLPTFSLSSIFTFISSVRQDALSNLTSFVGAGVF